MKVSMVELPEICIIGKEGLCTREKNIVSELWEQANAHFHEVADLGMKEADGSYVGFWGAMSDEQMNFLPWEDDFTRGRYLAGVEAVREMEAPEGWTKWTMPARTYLVVEVVPDRYAEIFREVIQKVIPERGLCLCGAVCDFTEPATGTGKLFFPVKEDKKILADGNGVDRG